MNNIDLSKIDLVDLVEEIRNRSHCSVIACILKDCSKEADVKCFQHADSNQELQLIAISTIMHNDVTNSAKTMLTYKEEKIK